MIVVQGARAGQGVKVEALSCVKDRPRGCASAVAASVVHRFRRFAFQVPP
jgi:hypothetical protein